MTATNSGKSAKPRGRPFPKGVAQNPTGAPKRGESWAELFNEIGNMTGEQVADKALMWAGKFKKFPKGVTLKQLVVIRAYAALLDESNARLLKEVMERAEGKLAQPVTGAGDNGELVVKVINASSRNTN